MKNKDIISKIKEKAYENVNKKLEEERKRTEEKINNELNVVERCLSYIKNKLVYKEIRKNFLPTEYVLADEEMFFDDYSKEDGYYKGIYFSDGQGCLFRVNGECYYDVRNLFPKYKQDFRDYYDRLARLNETFCEIQNGFESLKKQELKVKSMLEQLKQVEIDEEIEDEE